MTSQKYYRSPIDRLIEQSGLTAIAISQKMGIKYHRIVALRRCKSVSAVDVEACKTAIAELQRLNPIYETNAIEPVKRGRKKGFKLKPKTVEATKLAYTLGKSMVFITMLHEKTENERAKSVIEDFIAEVNLLLK